MSTPTPEERVHAVARRGEQEADPEKSEIRRLRLASLAVMATLVALGFASIAVVLYLLTAAGLVAAASAGGPPSVPTTAPSAAAQSAPAQSAPPVEPAIGLGSATASPSALRPSAAAIPRQTSTNDADDPAFLGLAPGRIPPWLSVAVPFLVAVDAGFLGACVAAAMSVSERRSNGWELSCGKQVPEAGGPAGELAGTGKSVSSNAARTGDGSSSGRQDTGKNKKKEFFNTRMAPSFLVRPFLGAAFGLFGYAALLSGTLVTFGKDTTTGTSTGNPEQLLALLAIGFLFGLFSKTLHDKLRDGFKAFVSA